MFLKAPGFNGSTDLTRLVFVPNLIPLITLRFVFSRLEIEMCTLKCTRKKTSQILELTGLSLAENRGFEQPKAQALIGEFWAK